MTFNPTVKLSHELNISEKQIAQVLLLLQEGNTIPFIARYRKEKTGSLDEVQLRTIKERADYLRELEDRREAILASIEAQGKLNEELKKKIKETETKSALEDLYLPYKPKRRTKATIAKEKGLEPLAKLLMEQPLNSSPEEEAAKYVDAEKAVPDIAAALEGARHIAAEWISEDAEIRSFVREVYQNDGILRSEVRKEYKEQATKYKQYYEFSELIKKIPSHRYLAIRRGEQEAVLSVKIEVEHEPILEEIAKKTKRKQNSPFAAQLKLAIEDSFARLIATSIESDIRVDLKMQSDHDAVEIFAENLRHLLLSAPMGTKSVIGIDPGLRTGCKCAAVTQTGKYLDTVTLFLTNGTAALEKARQQLLSFIKKYPPSAIAIGNGTASRETEAFVKEALKEAKIDDIIVVQVSESGASVYSASDVAREEFPDLDLTIRGAISIARRLQDPLAELVKVEPKSLGVGQYQHDVYQPLLEKKLHDVVESCVNQVGVDLNTASASLLAYVVGIGQSLSKKIVGYRDEKGAFRNRKQLMEIPGLGAKAFQQSAGFLRIMGGDNPLDRSAVHPESYAIVKNMADDLHVTLEELVGNEEKVAAIKLEQYKTESAGIETIRDILNELKKPGRDPRKSFEMPKFLEDVTKIEDLKPGMVIEGVVTNVTAFGAFVDIGVHQDGLVHISELSDKFIKDPSEAVKTGDKLKVKVLDVDLNLKRISLSAKSGTAVKPGPDNRTSGRQDQRPQHNRPKEKFSSNPFSKL